MRISECAGLVSSAAASQRTLRSSASLAITSGSKRRSEGTKDQMRLEVAWLSSSAAGSPRAASCLTIARATVSSRSRDTQAADRRQAWPNAYRPGISTMRDVSAQLGCWGATPRVPLCPLRDTRTGCCSVSHSGSYARMRRAAPGADRLNCSHRCRQAAYRRRSS